MILQEVRDIGCMYSNTIFRILQNAHLIHTIPWVASVAVTFKLINERSILTAMFLNYTYVSVLFSVIVTRQMFQIG